MRSLVADMIWQIAEFSKGIASCACPTHIDLYYVWRRILFGNSAELDMRAK